MEEKIDFTPSFDLEIGQSDKYFALPDLFVATINSKVFCPASEISIKTGNKGATSRFDAFCGLADIRATQFSRIGHIFRILVY